MNIPQRPTLNISEPDSRLLSYNVVDHNTVQAIIKRVKLPNCENDPIQISNIVHCENFHVIIDIFVEIINKSVESCIFPDSEERAIVKPIIKGSLDTQCLSSYRPMSNLSFLSKLLENAILDQLTEHMNLVNAILDSQSAYRRLYSTETAMCSVLNDLIVILDEGNFTSLHNPNTTPHSVTITGEEVKSWSRFSLIRYE